MHRFAEYQCDLMFVAREMEIDERRSAHRINGVGKPLVLALHPLPAGDLAIAR